MAKKPASGKPKWLVKKGNKPTTTKAKCGLQMPVMRLKKTMVAKATCAKVLRNAAIFDAAVLEYMVAEVIELAGNACRDSSNNKRTTITSRDIQRAIRNDEELSKVFKDVVIAKGGRSCMDPINPVLLKKKN